MRDVILTDRGPKPIGPYSQAIRTNGFRSPVGQNHLSHGAVSFSNWAVAAAAFW